MLNGAQINGTAIEFVLVAGNLSGVELPR